MFISPVPPKPEQPHHETDAELVARIAAEEAARWMPFAVGLGAVVADVIEPAPAGGVNANSRL